MHLLPTLKTQEAFDLPKHSSRIPGIAKAGIAVLAVSVLAGILLFERGTNAPQSGIAAPVGLPSASPQVSLPVADEPARVSASEQIKDATIETLPVIPTPPGDGMPVEVQHVTAPLTAPEPSPSDRAKDP